MKIKYDMLNLSEVNTVDRIGRLANNSLLDISDIEE